MNLTGNEQAYSKSEKQFIYDFNKNVSLVKPCVIQPIYKTTQEMLADYSVFAFENSFFPKGE